MTAALATRLVFIDTSAFEKKNFQFGQHSLGRLQELIAQEKLYLLITDVTQQEIESHLKKHSEESASKVKKLTKEAMFLRNTPELDCHGIFNIPKADDIFEIVNGKFHELLELESVELVSVQSVNPKIVFDAYFNGLPPFEKESKKHEFPDAFALEAIKKVSLDRCHSIYVISADGDMTSYADQEETLIPLNSVDELIDLVVRNDEELAEPTNFADQIFDELEENIVEIATEHLKYAEFVHTSTEFWDEEIADIKINSVSLSAKNLQDVSTEHADYEIEFEVEVTAEYSVPDYDRSPWDSEDKEYVHIFYNETVIKHKETYSAHVSISYSDGIKANAEIVELDFTDTIFDLNDTDFELISHKERGFI
ncbi:PIN domain-containing protein [Vibrio jasicida]|uniref:PIN domain-containing protein n=1 Tax=Vibrio jasicida TaxID=766224 RepID=UPI0040686FD0